MRRISAQFIIIISASFMLLLVGRGGVEPPSADFQSAANNLLSYRPKKENARTSLIQSVFLVIPSGMSWKTAVYKWRAV